MVRREISCHNCNYAKFTKTIAFCHYDTKRLAQICRISVILLTIDYEIVIIMLNY